MKVALFGATGKLGLVLQEQLAIAGYEVNALVHSGVMTKKTNLTYNRGDARNPYDVLRTIEGCEAVVDAIGGDEKSNIRSQAAEIVVKAMQANSIRRIIVMGGSGILRIGPWHFEQMPIFPRDKRLVSKDHERVHQILLDSGLVWTQVCPSFMTEGQAIGDYKVRVGHPFLFRMQSVRLADVASFIIKELTENNYLGKQVALMN